MGHIKNYDYDAFGVRGEFAVQYVADSKVNSDVQITLGFGGGTPSKPGISYNVSNSADVNSINDGLGWEMDFGGTANGIGGDFYGNSSATGYDMSYGLEGIPLEVHGDVTYTFSIKQNGMGIVKGGLGVLNKLLS